MRNLVLGAVAVVLLPVSVVLLVGVATGTLTGGIVEAAGSATVDGFTLDELREIESSVGQPPDSVRIRSDGRVGNRLAFGGAVTPKTTSVYLSSLGFEELATFFEDKAGLLGWARVDTPTPLIVQGDEDQVGVWRRDNLYLRLSHHSDDRALVEAGGAAGDHLYTASIEPIGDPSS